MIKTEYISAVGFMRVFYAVAQIVWNGSKGSVIQPLFMQLDFNTLFYQKDASQLCRS